MVLSVEAYISEELGCPSLPAQGCAHQLGISPNPVIYGCLQRFQGFLGGSSVKNPPAMQEPQETQVQSLGWEDPLEEEMASHSNILVMDRRAWQVTVHGVAKSQTPQKQLSRHTCIEVSLLSMINCWPLVIELNLHSLSPPQGSGIRAVELEVHPSNAGLAFDCPPDLKLSRPPP